MGEAMLTRGFIPISTQSSPLADQLSLTMPVGTPPPLPMLKNNVKTRNTKHKKTEVAFWRFWGLVCIEKWSQNFDSGTQNAIFGTPKMGKTAA